MAFNSLQRTLRTGDKKSSPQMCWAEWPVFIERFISELDPSSVASRIEYRFLVINRPLIVQ